MMAPEDHGHAPVLKGKRASLRLTVKSTSCEFTPGGCGAREGTMSRREQRYEIGEPGCGRSEGEESTTEVRAVRWWTHKEVLRHLRVDPRTLKRRMVETPPHFEPPWVNAGTRGRPKYMWAGNEVDRWWKKVNRWRISNSEGANTESGGVTPMGETAADRLLTRRLRKRSRGMSKERSPGGKGGNLVQHANQLISKKS